MGEDISNNYVAPDSFDSRTEWSSCSSISKIWDQSNCGSCWAFATANSMSDRMCIHKGKDFLISPEDVLSCCGFRCGFGCEGGYPLQAFKYWARTGICSGGEYGESGTCKPYSISPTESEFQDTPK